MSYKEVLGGELKLITLDSLVSMVLTKHSFLPRGKGWGY